MSGAPAVDLHFATPSAGAPGVRTVRARRDARRRAVRALGWGVVVFAAFQLGLAAAAETWHGVRDPMYGDKFAKLRARVEAAPAGMPVVVMLGSSRTGMAFHGRRAEEALGGRAVAFNFGIPAAGPVTELVYLRRLLDAGVTPDLLLVEVLPTMLADGPAAPIEQNWLVADRLRAPEVDVVIDHGFDADATRERWRTSVLVPWYALRFQLMSRLSPSALPGQVRMDWGRGADAWGWGTTLSQTVTDEEHRRKVAQAYAEYGPTLAGLRPGGPAAGALRELIAECRTRGIPLRLVLTPEGTTFRGWYPPDAEERLAAFLGTLDAEVIDARRWLPDDAFVDSHHMFAVGAGAFSERLAQDVIAPLLRDR